MMALQIIAAFFATVSFAVLFHIPREEYLFAGITGAFGWAVYLIMLKIYPSLTTASFVAAVALALLARIFAVYRKTPITVFLICGIFPLVPGADIYYTAYHFIMNENHLAAEKGIESIKIAVAIAVGIALIFSLPYNMFRNAFQKWDEYKLNHKKHIQNQN